MIGITSQLERSSGVLGLHATAQSAALGAQNATVVCTTPGLL
jgi:hypothetical protein